MGWGQRVNLHALRRHWMEKILPPQMGLPAGRDNSAPAATETQAMGPVPGVVTVGGMGEKVPTPRENQVGPGTGGQRALTVTFRRKRGKRGTPC